MKMLSEVHLLLAPAGLCVLAVMLCLHLFITLKAQLRAAERRMAAKLETAAAEAAAALACGETARAALREVHSSLAEIKEWSGALVPPPPARSGLNVSLRSQALRRRRLGEDPDAIARALGLPRNEVDLLLKVNSLLLANLPPAS